MNLGRAIKMCRTQRGMSQLDVALKSDCSVSYLSMLENNKRDPALSLTEKIAHALDVPISILFFLASEKDELSGIDKSLTGELSRMALDLLNDPSNNKSHI